MDKVLSNTDKLKNTLIQNILVISSLVLVLIPSLLRLANQVWSTEEQGHGGLIFAIICWLFYTKFCEETDVNSEPNILVSILSGVVAVLLYSIGRSQDILIFEIGSFIFFIISILSMYTGFQGIRKYLFPLFFIVFLIPIPGPIIDFLTGALKEKISYIAEYLLIIADYPIARSGVLLQVGQYQLLVADACSGLNSMFSLLAVGVLYIYIMAHSSLLRNGILLVIILPVAFVANIVRVVLLILITYHFGDEAGQGFIHNFAGMILFATSLSLIYLIDIILGRFLGAKHDKA